VPSVSPRRSASWLDSRPHGAKRRAIHKMGAAAMSWAKGPAPQSKPVPGERPIQGLPHRRGACALRDLGCLYWAAVVIWLKASRYQLAASQVARPSRGSEPSAEGASCSRPQRGPLNSRQRGRGHRSVVAPCASLANLNAVGMRLEAFLLALLLHAEGSHEEVAAGAELDGPWRCHA